MIKAILITIFSAFILFACASPYVVSDNVHKLSISFSGSLWNGESVPDGQQCQKFGGNESATPELKVQQIPTKADALVVEYTDRSWGPVGGHGKIGYYIEPGIETVVIPSVPAHSFDLPEGFFLVAEHLAPHWDTAGAYLPPCSGAGGLGHRYYATVRAIAKASPEDGKPLLLAVGEIEMGEF